MPYYKGRWYLYDERERREYGERKRQERRQEWQALWISRQGLKARLWTDKAIAEFLPASRKAGPIRAGQRLAVLSRLKLALLFLDTETTGLGNNAEALEIGLTEADGRVVFETRLRSTVEIDPQAAAVHGIDAPALRGEPSWPDVNSRSFIADLAATACPLRARSSR